MGASCRGAARVRAAQELHRPLLLSGTSSRHCAAPEDMTVPPHHWSSSSTPRPHEAKVQAQHVPIRQNEHLAPNSWSRWVMFARERKYTKSTTPATAIFFGVCWKWDPRAFSFSP